MKESANELTKLEKNGILKKFAKFMLEQVAIAAVFTGVSYGLNKLIIYLKKKDGGVVNKEMKEKWLKLRL